VTQSSSPVYVTQSPTFTPVYVTPTPTPVYVAPTPTHKDALTTNESLKFNDKITSQNGQFFAIMQADSNFVVYTASGKPLWASNTTGTGATFVVVQGDNNVVLYDGVSSPKWASNTSGRGSGAVRLVMQNDGNLVLYDGGSQALWASNSNTSTSEQKPQTKNSLKEDERLNHGEQLTSTNGKYRALMQNDGNFVLYGSRALWASNSTGTGASFVILQRDHNVVVYDSFSSPKWASNTNGRGSGSTVLVLQDDGNLVLYDGAGSAVWASGTGGQY